MNKNVKKLSVVALIAMILTVGLVVAVGHLGKNAADVSENIKTITINVFNKENENIYEKEIDTDKRYLFEVLDEEEALDIKAEDSQYGKYITSIKGIEQGDNYYWSYYIDGQYADVGVSGCEIENGKTYDFKIENMNR